MKPADVFLAVLVAVIWGLAFVASRLALDELSPALMTAMRFAIAAVPRRAALDAHTIDSRKRYSTDGRSRSPRQ